MTPRALIFGSSGQLGVEISRVLHTRGFEVKKLERKQSDITDPLAVEQQISGFDPALVFNCAAYNQVDVAESEPQLAFLVNALGVRNLAVACRQNDSRLIHFSTDYVFDGTLGRPYTERDATHPTGAYAVSKLAGELYAEAYLDNPLVIRTSGVFGPAGMKTNRGNFVELMLRLANTGQPIRVVEDHVASPTYAPALAECSVELAVREAGGLFHIGGGRAISWFAYARMIFDMSGLAPDLRPTDEREYRTAARRPKFSALANTRLEQEQNLPLMPPLEDAIGKYLRVRRDYLL